MNTPILQPALLKVKQAANYLAISERTTWTLIKDGRLPAVRFGKILRIDRTDLDGFIRRAKGEGAGR